MEKLLTAFATLISSLVVSGTVNSVYRPNVDATFVNMLDAGIPWPTHVVTCPVRVLSSECQEYFGLNLYDYVDFGVVVSDTDGARSVLLPPLGANNSCIALVNFEHCSLVECLDKVAACAKFGQANPFTLNQGARKCVRRNTARGFGDCRFLDGGMPDELTIHNVAKTTGTCEITALPVDSSGACYILAEDVAENLTW
jgi:hypothetical protein